MEDAKTAAPVPAAKVAGKAWSALFEGSKTEIIALLAKAEAVPEVVKKAVADMLAMFPADAPTTVRKEHRLKDPALQVLEPAQLTALGPDIWQDVTFTNTGKYRVSTCGHPELNVPVVISIEPEMFGAKVVKS